MEYSSAMMDLKIENVNSYEILKRINLILEKGKPPFDYGNILFRDYNKHLEYLF